MAAAPPQGGNPLSRLLSDIRRETHVFHPRMTFFFLATFQSLRRVSCTDVTPELPSPIFQLFSNVGPFGSGGFSDF